MDAECSMEPPKEPEFVKPEPVPEPVRPEEPEPSIGTGPTDGTVTPGRSEDESASLELFMEETPLTIKPWVEGGDNPAENDENVLCLAELSSSSSSSLAFKFLFRLRFGFECILE